MKVQKSISANNYKLLDTTPYLPYIFGAMYKRQIKPLKSKSYGLDIFFEHLQENVETIKQ